MSTLSRTVVLLISLSACGNPEGQTAVPSAPPPLPTVAKAPPLAPVGTEAPTPSPDALPIPEDFEAEAETTITTANYKDELRALGQQIEADAKAGQPPK